MPHPNPPLNWLTSVIINSALSISDLSSFVHFVSLQHFRPCNWLSKKYLKNVCVWCACFITAIIFFQYQLFKLVTWNENLIYLRINLKKTFPSRWKKIRRLRKNAQNWKGRLSHILAFTQIWRRVFF